MPDELPRLETQNPGDPGEVWRNQQEELPMNLLPKFLNRRTRELRWSTRNEILISSIGSIFFIAVAARAFQPTFNPLWASAVSITMIWALLTIYRFRDRIFAREEKADVASTGLEFYRTELERRRDHLRSTWIWHGPLLLSLAICVAMLFEKAFVRTNLTNLWNVAPFTILLVIWVMMGISMRRRQAYQIQTELDELSAL